MLGGDEVSAIVLDLGFRTCKAGYSGEDSPKSYFPSVVGVVEGNAEKDKVEISAPADADKKEKDKKTFPKMYVGNTALGYRRDNMEVHSPLVNGMIDNFDYAEKIWNHALKEQLIIDTSEHPILLSEATQNNLHIREKTVERMFECFNVPALFLAKNAVLASFAAGRSTSLVVDSGGGSTTVAPVYEGYVLQKSVFKSPIGGEFLSECLYNCLEEKGIKIRPRYSFKRKEIQPGVFNVENIDYPLTTESYKKFIQMQIASDIKENVCRVPDNYFDENTYANVPTTPYELPDGQVIEVGSDRFKVADIIFNPTLLKAIPKMENFENLQSLKSLQKMVIESINLCDPDIRRELFTGILLSGGNSLLQQLKERLEKELADEAPQIARVKVISSGNGIERKFAVWIGGSILASLGSFQQMWFSKSEYDENGASYVHRKCP